MTNQYNLEGEGCSIPGALAGLRRYQEVGWVGSYEPGSAPVRYTVLPNYVEHNRNANTVTKMDSLVYNTTFHSNSIPFQNPSLCQP